MPRLPAQTLSAEVSALKKSSGATQVEMESMSVRAFAGGPKTRREFAAVASAAGAGSSVTTNVSPLQRARSLRSPEATAALSGKTTNPLGEASLCAHGQQGT